MEETATEGAAVTADIKMRLTVRDDMRAHLRAEVEAARGGHAADGEEADR